MALEDTQAIDEEAADRQAQAEFDAGAAMEAGAKAEAKTEAKAAVKPAPEKAEAKAAAPKAEAKPRYVQITEDQFAALDAGARKALVLEGQLSKAFGTLGNLQKVVNELKAETPRAGKVVIPEDAFAEMARDFPELATQIRAGMEAALRGATGTGPASAEIDPEHVQKLVGEHAARLRAEAEIEALEDSYPDWRTIVGAVDVTTQQPDPDNAFRKWLSTKDTAYQARVNSTSHAAVISRAIERFQKETGPQASTAGPDARAQRTARIQAAVKPRGDGGPPATGHTEQDEFEAGFAAR